MAAHKDLLRRYREQGHELAAVKSENERLRQLLDVLARRVQAQSELLARHAERRTL
jgi:cell shape-determining protein MreC